MESDEKSVDFAGAAAAALAESKARLELATSAAGLGIWDWDIRTNAFVYSARAREISGLPPEGAITYEMVRGVTHPEDLPRTSAQAERAIDPAIKSEEPYQYRILRPSGEIRWVLAHGKAEFESHDGVERPIHAQDGRSRTGIRSEIAPEARLIDCERSKRRNVLPTAPVIWP